MAMVKARGVLGLGRWARRCSSGVRSEDSAQLPERAATSGTGGSVGPRFYKVASVRPAGDDSFTVFLDKYTLKTPHKNPVTVPTQALALAVAAEWEWQRKGGIRPFTMPLMKLAATAIDRLPKTRDEVIKNLMNYCDSDSVYCRAPESEPLFHKQAELLDPLVKWVETKIGTKPTITSSILINKQPKEVFSGIETLLAKLNNWELSAVDALVSSARSLVIGLAIADGYLDVERAMKVIRVDEDFQIDKWGLVEGGHDIDIADLRVKIISGSIFYRLLKD